MATAAPVPWPPLPEGLLALARAETAGEALAWAARPDAGREARAALPALLVAVPWTVLGLHWLARTAEPLREALSGVAGGAGVPALTGAAGLSLTLLLAGLWLLTAPLRAHRRAASTVWAVTDRRLLRLRERAGSGAEVETWVGAQVGAVSAAARPDGGGVLVLELRRVRADGAATTERRRLRLPNARGAEAAVLALRDRAAPAQRAAG